MAIMVVIYEDNKGLRESLSNMIDCMDELLLLGAFGAAVDVAEQTKTLRPDVILMDIEMPGITGIEAVAKIRQLNMTVPVIMLTVFDDERYVLDAIFAGASGYLLKNNIPDKLLSAVKEVLAGGAPMSPTIARMVLQHIRPVQKDRAAAYRLTSREKDILTSLAHGNSYKMVAAEQGITIETVRSHIKSIYEKLQVHSQTEAVVKAIRERLL